MPVDFMRGRREKNCAGSLFVISCFTVVLFSFFSLCLTGYFWKVYKEGELEPILKLEARAEKGAEVGRSQVQDCWE